MNSKYQNKNQIVYKKIRDAIISGEFKPGSRIVIDTLALELKVSHSPIRECLRLLEAEGFVTIRPFAGVTVTDLEPELIIEVFELLESLEIITSCRASACATPEQFENLRAMINNMEADVSSPNRWSVKNFEFHMAICEYANMTITKNMMHRALLHWDRLRQYYLEKVSSQRIKQAQLEHQELLKAMISGNEVYIKDVIEQHNKAALRDYLAYVRETQQVDL